MTETPPDPFAPERDGLAAVIREGEVLWRTLTEMSDDRDQGTLKALMTMEPDDLRMVLYLLLLERGRPSRFRAWRRRCLTALGWRRGGGGS